MVTEVICIVSELMSIAGCDVMLYFGEFLLGYFMLYIYKDVDIGKLSAEHGSLCIFY